MSWAYTLQPFTSNTNNVALTSLLHHRSYVRSCQTSLGMLLRTDTELLITCVRLSTTLKNKYISLKSNCQFAFHSDSLRGIHIEHYRLPMKLREGWQSCLSAILFMSHITMIHFALELTILGPPGRNTPPRSTGTLSVQDPPPLPVMFELVHY